MHDVDAVYLGLFLILLLFQLDSDVGTNLVFVNNYLNWLFVFIFEIKMFLIVLNNVPLVLQVCLHSSHGRIL